MRKFTSVEEYIEHFPEWDTQLRTLRELVLANDATEETVKWGSPVYTVNGKNVVGLGAFKSYVGLWFFQGALLSDNKDVLVNAQEGKTQALRQWRFSNNETLPTSLIKKYIEEAVNNQLNGKTVPIQKKKKSVETPEELSKALQTNTTLANAFKQLTPFKQNEFKEYIGTAKRAATRESRLQKSIPIILAGNGLNDQYR